ncbi:MAG: SMI1/KNR4 family protein [Lachnospiraceae bacterium]|nr:SMI1/KNR4 family protein [Lachnospiraceae bacterium]
MYDEIIKIISNAGEDVDFAQFGEGISDEWIDLAEKRLDVKFPNSYVWWLKNYNGGEIFGEEVYSIYGIDFDDVVGGDIVYINELSRKDDSKFNDKLIISEPNDELFYFDLTQGLVDGEYPVYEYYTKAKYADCFLEFLKRRILEI